MTSTGSILVRIGYKSIVGIDDLHPSLQQDEKKDDAKKKSQASASKQKSKPHRSIHGFNGRSRNQLIKAINNLTEIPEYLVTLTYANDVPTDSRQWKKDIDKFRNRLKYAYPESWWIWRIKPQEHSGRPCFHMVGSVYAHEQCDDFCSWLHPKWCAIIKAKTKEADRATRVQPITTDMELIARHMCKLEEYSQYKAYEDGWLERFTRWGRFGRAKMPEQEPESFFIDHQTMEEIKDMVVDNIEADILGLRRELKQTDSQTPHKTLLAITKSISDKRKHIKKIENSPYWFWILDPDHLADIKQYLREKQAAGRF